MAARVCAGSTMTAGIPPWPRDSSTSAVLDSLILQLVVLLALVGCSALLTGAEAAYFSLGRARLRRLAKQPGTAEPVVTPR